MKNLLNWVMGPVHKAVNWVDTHVKALFHAPKLTPSGVQRGLAFAVLALCCTTVIFAQNAAGDYSAGTTALSTVTSEIAKYLPYVVKLCYAIAGTVAVVGAISVYIKMNNEEQDVKKSIMMIVGACIFLVAAAQALPLFFGVTN